MDFGPEGYSIAQAGAGLELVLGSQHRTLDLLARNLFDTEYTSFLSRYRRYPPDPGRTVTMRVTWVW